MRETLPLLSISYADSSAMSVLPVPAIPTRLTTSVWSSRIISRAQACSGLQGPKRSPFLVLTRRRNPGPSWFL
jgi:hypothetical protein